MWKRSDEKRETSRLQRQTDGRTVGNFPQTIIIGSIIIIAIAIAIIIIISAISQSVHGQIDVSG